MNYKLLALDLDGTTLDKNLNLSNGNLHAIQKVVDIGIVVAIITGKMFSASLPFVKKITGSEYLFASNGAHVYEINSNSELESYPLCSNDVVKILSVLNYHNALYRVYSRDTMFSPVESYLVDSIRKDYPHLPVMIGEIPKNQTYYKIYVQSEDEILRKVSADLKDIPVQIHPSDNNNLEITSKYANKGKALRFLKKHLNIPTSAVISIGNHDNDLPMFAESGFSVAVKNAPLYVQEKADFITKHCEDDGVAYAINKFIV